MKDKSKFMLRAIDLSIQSAKTKGGPFGCVIVKENKIIAEGFNQVTSNNDPTAHAEILAIRKACKNLNQNKLNGLSLFVTLEPCKMCEYSIYQAGIKKIYLPFFTCPETEDPFKKLNIKIDYYYLDDELTPKNLKCDLLFYS